MMIRYSSDVTLLTAEHLAGFFAGWPTHPSPEAHAKILNRSHAVWLAFDHERCVGFINALSDGVFYAYIPLLEVLPQYRGQGIGTELVQRMVATLESMYAIDIVCDKSVAPFYASLGFDRCNAMIKRNPSNQSAISARGNILTRSKPIRAIAICVFQQGSKILVETAFDHSKREEFYRPPGGGIHFGERSDVALRREIQEELGVEIENPRLLGVLENLFTLEGEPGHEVVFVYDAAFKDKAMYELDVLAGREGNGQPYEAFWIDIASIGLGGPPVYPDGLIELLNRE